MQRTYCICSNTNYKYSSGFHLAVRQGEAYSMHHLVQSDHLIMTKGMTSLAKFFKIFLRFQRRSDSSILHKVFQFYLTRTVFESASYIRFHLFILLSNFHILCQSFSARAFANIIPPRHDTMLQRNANRPKHVHIVQYASRNISAF